MSKHKELELPPISIDILNNNVKLENECWCCSDTEKEPMYKNDDGTCEKCGGTKFVLTDAGEAIINLVKRHIKE